MRLFVPPALQQACQADPNRAQWLRGVPLIVDRLLSSWECRVESVFEGSTAAWVARVRTAGDTAVLKVPWPHFEAKHEADALAFWKGGPAVRLWKVDAASGAMLIEHCRPGETLRLQPEGEQDMVIAELLRAIWQFPASRPFRPLSVMLARWRLETMADAGRWPDPGLVRQGLEVLQEMSGSAVRALVLATDLHAGNVLSAEREPWLLIDPKPFLGDPAYDLTQHLLNCPGRLHREPRDLVDRFAELCGVDCLRVRLWLFGRLAAEPRSCWDETKLELARRLAP